MSYRLNPGEDRIKVSAQIDKMRELNAQEQRKKPYFFARNKEQWWEIVDSWWPELLNLFSYEMDLGKPLDPSESLLPFAVTLTRLKDNRDVELASYFGMVWSAAPDHGSIHGRPGWNVLCDLCSESYVLGEEN